MSQRDYYDILGVSRTASDDEIKKAHRRLARKWHPDVNQSDDASKRFGEIQEAYDILSDEKKREAYDRFGHVGVGSAGPPPRSGAGGFEWSDFVGDGGGGFNVGGPGGSGGSVNDFGSLFEQLLGAGGGRPGHHGQSPFQNRSAQPHTPPRKGRNLEHTITVGFLVAANGGKEKIRLRRDGKDQTIDITIPRGVEDGTKLRLRGKGHPGEHGQPAGDLLLRIQIAPHPYYRRDGLDISMDVPITIAEAALGVSISLPTLKDRVTIKVPPGTGSGRKLRVSGHGMTNESGKAGDFYAVISIEAPAELAESDREVLREFGGRLENPRCGGAWE